MHIDKENQYATAQVFTASAASTYKVKSGANVGIGEPMVVVITLDEDAKESDGNETYKVKLRTDDLPAFGSPTDVGQEVTIPRTAEIGDRFVIPVPPDSSCEEWTDIYFTNGGTNPSITVTANLLPLRLLENLKVYPSGTVIS